MGTNVSNGLFRAGYVAFIGRPNVGKSTLLNSLLKQKTAIVSPKPQTTRNRILGILHGDNFQIICLDTPGLIDPSTMLQKSLVKTSVRTIKDADLIYVIIDAKRLTSDDEIVFSYTEKASTPALLVINKTDLVKKGELLPLMAEMDSKGLFKDILPVSALNKEGLDVLISATLENLPSGMPFYPPDIISDEPERFFVAEIIREQIFLQFGEEIPYATAVKITEFKERPHRKDFISAAILVERSSQKGIMIGRQARALKKLGTAARAEIEKFLGRSIFLELHIQVRKGWRKDPAKLKDLGYL